MMRTMTTRAVLDYHDSPSAMDTKHAIPMRAAPPSTKYITTVATTKSKMNNADYKTNTTKTTCSTEQFQFSVGEVHRLLERITGQRLHQNQPIKRVRFNPKISVSYSKTDKTATSSIDDDEENNNIVHQNNRLWYSQAELKQMKCDVKTQIIQCNEEKRKMMQQQEVPLVVDTTTTIPQNQDIEEQTTRNELTTSSSTTTFRGLERDTYQQYKYKHIVNKCILSAWKRYSEEKLLSYEKFLSIVEKLTSWNKEIAYYQGFIEYFKLYHIDSHESSLNETFSLKVKQMQNFLSATKPPKLPFKLIRTSFPASFFTTTRPTTTSVRQTTTTTKTTTTTTTIRRAKRSLEQSQSQLEQREQPSQLLQQRAIRRRL